MVEYGQEVDACMGHTDNNCLYHYSASPGLSDDCGVDIPTCGLVGYLYDGIPILNHCKVQPLQPDLDPKELKSCYKLISGEDGTKTHHYEYDLPRYHFNVHCRPEYYM